MEVRSSRRMRTLVTRMAHRGLSANEIARALISMMARSTTLQSKAGYIDARPPTASSAKSTCNARPDHTFGSKAEVCPLARHVRSALKSRHRHATRSGPVRAIHDILHRSIQHIIRSSGRRWHRGPSSRPNRRGIVRFGDQHYLGGHRSWT